MQELISIRQTLVELRQAYIACLHAYYTSEDKQSHIDQANSLLVTIEQQEIAEMETINKLITAEGGNGYMRAVAVINKALKV